MDETDAAPGTLFLAIIHAVPQDEDYRVCDREGGTLESFPDRDRAVQVAGKLMSGDWDGVPSGPVHVLDPAGRRVPLPGGS